MSKLIVKTKNILLVDTISGEVIYEDRPSIVTDTSFVHGRAALGQVSIIKNDLPEEASDDTFKTFWLESDKNEELAISSYLSSMEKAKSPEAAAIEAAAEPVKTK